MDTDCNLQTLEFEALNSRKVTARFDGGDLTSDAGNLGLRELEHRFGLTDRLADCFEDYRDPNHIEHSLKQLLRQYIFGLVAGYPHLSIHDQLRQDTAFAIACDKSCPDPSGGTLAASATLSRLQTGVVEGGPEHRKKKLWPM